MKKETDYKSNYSKIDLNKFLFMNTKTQEDSIKKTLKEIYNDNLNVDDVHIDKVLNVAFDNNDKEIFLPKGLSVSKVNNELVFKFRKLPYLPVICFTLAFILFGFAGGTYFGARVAQSRLVNIDLDGDGVADLNIDLNDDLKAEINVDTNSDNKPDLNIDYKGNRTIMFNYIQDGVLHNPVNYDTNNDGICDLNCDLNEDGWPDINIDIDEDGEAELDLDTNNDGIKDLNLDTNGDLVCDINCDINNDKICDSNCIILYKNSDSVDSGASGEEYDNVDLSSVLFLVNYLNTSTIEARDILPTDMADSKDIDKIEFEIKNQSSATLYYNIDWVVTKNTFIDDSNNFEYRVISETGFNSGWKTAPDVGTTVLSDTRLEIPADSTIKYSVELRLRGTGNVQNEDQGKSFNGRIQVDFLGMKVD